MKPMLKRLITATILLLFFYSGAAGTIDYSTAPTTNHGQKWQIGYLDK